jgi:hypothetical protein
MKRLVFILLITVLSQASCENATSLNKEVKTSNPKKIDSVVTSDPEPVVDSVDYDTTHVLKETTEQKDTSMKKKKSNPDGNSIHVENAFDVNKYKNVRDDPDYVGTPCKYVDGKCIRHNHKDEEELPEDLDGE